MLQTVSDIAVLLGAAFQFVGGWLALRDGLKAVDELSGGRFRVRPHCMRWLLLVKTPQRQGRVIEARGFAEAKATVTANPTILRANQTIEERMKALEGGVRENRSAIASLRSQVGKSERELTKIGKTVAGLPSQIERGNQESSRESAEWSFQLGLRGAGLVLFGLFLTVSGVIMGQIGQGRLVSNGMGAVGRLIDYIRSIVPSFIR